MTARILEIPKAPPNRGRLLSAAQVRELISGEDPPSLDWIYAHVPHKMKLSQRCVRWYECDVLAWLEELRVA